VSAYYRILILLRAPRAVRPFPVPELAREVAMDIVHPRVAGIDVHKKVIWVAVRLPGSGPGERTVTVKSFKTFWRQLQKMAAWLGELGVTDATMESTGIYWRRTWPSMISGGGICYSGRPRRKGHGCASYGSSLILTRSAGPSRTRSAVATGTAP
jgi:hypothetical protein